MWGLFGSLSLSGRIGLVGGLLGFLVGMGAVLLAAPNVVGLSIVVASVGLTALCVWLAFGSEIRRQRLLSTGIQASATVLGVEETGWTVQGTYPVGKFHLRVQPPTGEPYEVTARCIVSRWEVPMLQPGATVSVLIDPKDPRRVVLA